MKSIIYQPSPIPYLFFFPGVISEISSLLSSFIAWSYIPTFYFLHQPYPNMFFNVSSSFGDTAAPSYSPKTTVIVIPIAEIVIGRAVIIAIVAIPCSQNKTQILPSKDSFFNGLFNPCNLCLKIFSIL